MKKEYEALYIDMLADISRCLALDHPEKDNVEDCFWIAKNYWEKLQDFIRLVRLRSDEDQVSFYRHVKPQFASYIEYFSLLSEGLQFVPPEIPFPEDLKNSITEEAWNKKWQQTVGEYWTQEENRGNRYYNKNREFLDYCASNCTDKDHEYFTIGSGDLIDMTQRRAHNRDTELFTPHEEILTTWEAYKLYSAYIKTKVNESLRICAAYKGA